MERRELIKLITILTGGAVVGMDVFLSGCTNASTNTIVFNADTIALLDEIGETILPKTATPGAKDAQIGKFMQTIVADCYFPADQEIFTNGIETLKKECTKKYNKDFLACNMQERTTLVKQFDEEAKQYNIKKYAADAEITEKTKGTKEYKREAIPNHWFSLVKQLTMWGFFTSEVGASQALRYIPVPGRYDGCVDYKKGDRAIFPSY
jgi:hypothetical protein